jgi:peptide/nickel transport system substrate-binding protein
VLVAGAACSAPAAAPAPTAAAGAAQAPTSAPAPAAPAAKRGGTFHWASQASFPHMDPHLTSTAAMFGYGIGQWYSRLLKLKLKDVQLPAFIPTGDAAESWEQPDDITYVFKLRPNMKWHNVAPVNGRALVADDIIFSYDRQRTKDPTFVNASILSNVVKLEAPDKQTLKITIDKPSADFLLNLSSTYSVIIAKEVVDQKGDLKTGPVIGTGPFIMDTFDPQGDTFLRRNPDYYMTGQPYVDTYQFTVVRDAETFKSAFRAGQTDYIPPGSVTPTEAETYRKAIPNVQLPVLKGIGGGTELGLRQDRAPFNDPRVRQAIYKAVDAEAIIQTALGSGWFSVGLPLPAQDWFLPQDEMSGRYKRDLDGARKLLKDAGQDGGFEFALSTNISPEYQAATELIVAQLREVNIRATIRVLDGVAYYAQVHDKGDFEAYVGPVVTFPSVDATLFGKYHSKGARNITKINDPKLDQMIEQQTALGRNPDARKKLLLDIQRQILDQSYIRYLSTLQGPVALQPYVRDFYAGFAAINFETDRFVYMWLDK